MKLLSEECPGCVKEHELENYTGRKVAIDASMAMYQFLVAVRSGGAGPGAMMQLTNEAGEVTSHIQGMFNRTIRLMTAGVRPVLFCICCYHSVYQRHLVNRPIFLTGSRLISRDLNWLIVLQSVRRQNWIWLQQKKTVTLKKWRNTLDV